MTPLRQAVPSSRDQGTPGVSHSPRQGIEKAFVCAAIIAMVVVFFHSTPRNGQFWWFDSSGHAMDGLFYRDLIAAMPIHNAWGYAINYYLKYPCLTVGFYPPVFHLALALCYALFGFSGWSAYLAVALFDLAAVAGVYCLARVWLDRLPSLAAAILFLSAPGNVLWGREVMLEMPAYAFAIWAVYLIFRYVRSRAVWQLLLAMTLLATAISTKQTVAFVACPVLYVLWRADGASIWRRKANWLALALFLVELVPIAVLTAKFGLVNVQQVADGYHDSYSRTSIACWTYYAKAMAEILGWVILPVGLLALGLVVLYRPLRRESYIAGFLVVWMVSGYVFFSLIGHKMVRYGLFIPFPVFLATFLALDKFLPRLLRNALPALAVLLFVTNVIAEPARRVEGYEDAARLVSANAEADGLVLLFVQRDANLIFNVLAEGRRTDLSFVRADKLLTSYKIHRSEGLRQSDLSETGIAALLDRLGVNMVVYQPGLWDDVEVIRRFDSVLNSQQFEKQRGFAVTSKQGHTDRELVVYRNRHPVHRNDAALKIEVPMIGLTLSHQ